MRNFKEAAWQIVVVILTVSLGFFKLAYLLLATSLDAGLPKNWQESVMPPLQKLEGSVAKGLKQK